MANSFNRTLTTQIGTAATTVYSLASPKISATVVGINVANITTTNIQVSIQFYTASSNAYIVKNVVIAPNTSLAAIGGDQKLVLLTGDSIKITSDTAASVDVMVSTLELS